MLVTTVGTPPTPRYGATAVYDVLNDRLIVVGGYDGALQRNDAWQLSLSGTPTWTNLSPGGVLPPGRSFHVACYDAPRRQLVMFGGWTGAGYLGDTWTLSLGASPAWSLVAGLPVSPPARSLAAVAYDSSREQMVMFGGWNGSHFQDTWTLALSGAPTWSLKPSATLPQPRREVSMAYDPVGDRLVMFGGNSQLGVLGDTWERPLGGASDWHPINPVTRPAARYGHATTWSPTEHRAIVFGGTNPFDTGHVDDTWFIDSSGPPTWKSLVPQAPRNYSVALDPVTRQVLVFGGEISMPGVGRVLTDQLQALSLSSTKPEWEIIVPAGPGPSKRYASRAIWDAPRDRMLIFGGYDGLYQNDIWEYRPRPVPTWTRIFPGGAPPVPRFAGGFIHDVARDRLLVFGGYGDSAVPDSFVSLNDLWELPLSGPGALFWNPLTATGTAPSPRWGFVMVPDPSRSRAVLFGGGSSPTSTTNHAYALSLSTNPPNWSLISAGGTPPAPRIIHAGVLEPHGDRLVLFGGFSNDFFLNDAWALSLGGANIWSELFPLGARPAGRNSISAIYDEGNRQMVVPFGFAQGSPNQVFFPDTWALRWDAAVPIASSLLEVSADASQVRMVWFVRDAVSVSAEVERRDAGGDWSAIGVPPMMDADRLSMTDRSVVPGTRYGYRLRLRSSGEETLTAETEVDVPSGQRLELAGAKPNPTQGGPLRVAFSLARAGDGRIDLIDLAGRRVATRSLQGMGPGSHQIEFAAAARYEPGVYLLRLVTPERTLTSKALITR